jgi:uncharacterized protein
MVAKSLGAALAAAWFAMAALSALSATASAQDQTAGERLLVVRGEGSASAAPDLARLRLGVDTQAVQARDALSANAAAMAKIIAALKADGIAEKDVQTSTLSITPIYSDDPKQARSVTGYHAANMVAVRIRDLQQTGAIIDQLVALGSNDIAALAFDLADPSAVENEARAAAVRDALAKAKLYANTAGVELGPILKITDEPAGNIAPSPRVFSAAPLAGASTPVESGELTFHAAVEMTWNIK